MRFPFLFPPDFTNLDDLLELSKKIIKIFIICNLLVLGGVVILFRRKSPQVPGSLQEKKAKFLT